MCSEMSPREITPRQREYLEAIQSETSRLGYAPTQREVALAAGRHFSSMQAALRVLERDGYVTHAYATSRSLRITEKGRAVLAQEAAE
jgi:Mn-dependent DtxR family transcriptional regulator